MQAIDDKARGFGGDPLVVLLKTAQSRQLLVERAREGDADAFSVVYERYAGTTFGFVLIRTRDRALTEEITSRRSCARSAGSSR